MFSGYRRKLLEVSLREMKEARLVRMSNNVRARETIIRNPQFDPFEEK